MLGSSCFSVRKNLAQIPRSATSHQYDNFSRSKTTILRWCLKRHESIFWCKVLLQTYWYSADIMRLNVLHARISSRRLFLLSSLSIVCLLHTRSGAVPSEPAAACASNHHGSIININLFESCWAANSTWLGHVNHAWRSTKRCETRWSCQSSNWSAFSLQVFEQLCLHSRLRYHVSKAILKKDGTSWSFTSATETMATASFTNWIEEPSSKCWRPISSNNDWWLKPQCERYEIVHWARSCYLSRLLWMNDQATNLRPWDHGKYLDRNPYL